MKKWLKYFLEGLMFLAPIYFSLYFIARVFISSDGLFGRLLSPWGLYYPGLGLVLALVVITGTGMIVSRKISEHFVKIIDCFFAKIPIIKLIYGLVKDIFASFSGGRKSFSEVVRVALPDRMSVIGFKTKDLGKEIVVYLPQAYQVTGFVLIVPKDRVTTLKITVEEAMKFILSGGLAGDLPEIDN